MSIIIPLTLTAVASILHGEDRYSKGIDYGGTFNTNLTTVMGSGDDITVVYK